MKKLFLFGFILSLSFSLNASINTTQAIQSLSQYNRTAINTLDKLSILKKLCGDTISFEFLCKFSYLDNFTKEIPDTIWIKKRPKKNPVEGKHYTLSYVYKGTLVGDSIMTPISEITNKKFGVLSIDSKNMVSYYITKTDYIFKLIDLDDLSIVECIIPENIHYDVALYSCKADKLLDSLKNSTLYINTSSSYSPKYTPAILSDYSYKLLFEYSSPVKYLRSIINFQFNSKSGKSISLTFDDNSYTSYHSSDEKIIISEEEYNSNFVIHTINSDIDQEIIDSNIEKPFGFTCIIGVPKNSISYMAQTIDPSEFERYTWTRNYKFAPEEAMFVAGTEIVKGMRFYKMAYNGKAFFMKADDIKLSPEYSAKLDSLNKSSDEVKNYFFHNTLALSNAIYFQRLNNAIAELDSYKQYGLAIKSWNVYDESEYTDGTGVNVTFYNPTHQIIKYISFTFQGYNAVDDPCGRVITKRCIGPIGPEETASYQFEYVWFTDIVEYAKLRSIVVTYKNGTTKNISKPNSIIFSDDLRKELNSTNPVENFN